MGSESSLPSSDSSLTDTLNDRLSEGQWLLSRSEGQMAPIPITDAVRHEYLRKCFHNAADVSGASTLRDTDDLDLDEDPRSEGEFLHKGLPRPEEDPMLQLLAQMQKNPLMMGHGNMGPEAVRQVLQQRSDPRRSSRGNLSATGRSVGEMSVGQVPNARLVMV